VRFGVAGTYSTKVITAKTACTTKVFGDPKKGASKTCSYSSLAR
jgi:hypothetical protein